MSNQRRRFKLRRVGLMVVFSLVLLCPFLPNASAETVSVKKNETTMMKDLFEHNIYYEGVQYLHLERLYRDLFHKKVRAGDINVYDEVPDSAFFTNRHGKKRFSTMELETGHQERNSGPDTSQKITVYSGKFEGLHPGFFVRDSRGDEYLIKFDAMGYQELMTGAEVIASRVFYAIGYHIPQYTIIYFKADQLVPLEGAKIVDDSGFKKDLTQEKLDEYMLFIPQDAQGRYRASASKMLSGVSKGYMPFQGRRRGDAKDRVLHEDRRVLRALGVFASWINNYDVRPGNTLDFLVDENGQTGLKHYLIDFNTALGASANGPKPPMMGHEYLLDAGETIKAFLSLGLWEKPWQKRFQENEQVNESPAVGYFDNRYFDPGSYKTQVPTYAFKDLTLADAFWASKIIMTFTNDDIRAMVKAGKLTEKEDEDSIVKVLAERRDIIGRYWFDKASPLDQFSVSGNRLSFKDLSVVHGFHSAKETEYSYDIIAREGKRGKKIESRRTSEAVLELDPSWLCENKALDILIRVRRSENRRMSPYVLVQLDHGRITGIRHED